MRVRKYLAERARQPGLDFEVVNGLNANVTGREAFLLASDLTTLLNAVGVPTVEQSAPYRIGDNCSWLEGSTWHVCEVTAIDPTDDDMYRVYLDLNTAPGRGVAKTVDARGVGEGVAPLRDH